MIASHGKSQRWVNRIHQKHIQVDLTGYIGGLWHKSRCLKDVWFSWGFRSRHLPCGYKSILNWTLGWLLYPVLSLKCNLNEFNNPPVKILFRTWVELCFPPTPFHPMNWLFNADPSQKYDSVRYNHIPSKHAPSSDIGSTQKTTSRKVQKFNGKLFLEV